MNPESTEPSPHHSIVHWVPDTLHCCTWRKVQTALVTVPSSRNAQHPKPIGSQVPYAWNDEVNELPHPVAHGVHLPSVETGTAFNLGRASRSTRDGCIDGDKGRVFSFLFSFFARRSELGLPFHAGLVFIQFGLTLASARDEPKRE